MAVAAPVVVPFSVPHHYKCTHCGKRMRGYADYEEFQHADCGGLVKLDPPPTPTALDDARRFLDLHPWATTEADNPVELLAALVAEIDAEGGDDDDDAEEPEVTGESDAPTRVERLVGFIRKLRESCKISEQEFQSALALIAE